MFSSLNIIVNTILDAVLHLDLSTAHITHSIIKIPDEDMVLGAD